MYTGQLTKDSSRAKPCGHDGIWMWYLDLEHSIRQVELRRICRIQGSLVVTSNWDIEELVERDEQLRKADAYE